MAVFARVESQIVVQARMSRYLATRIDRGQDPQEDPSRRVFGRQKS